MFITNVWIEHPSSSCKHGRQLICVDSNEDGKPDDCIVIGCDGNQEKKSVVTVGVGIALPEEGVLARQISGDFDNSFVIELYTEEGEEETTLGYMVQEQGKPDLTFYFNGYYEE